MQSELQDDCEELDPVVVKTCLLSKIRIYGLDL